MAPPCFEFVQHGRRGPREVQGGATDTPGGNGAQVVYNRSHGPIGRQGKLDAHLRGASGLCRHVAAGG